MILCMTKRVKYYTVNKLAIDDAFQFKIHVFFFPIICVTGEIALLKSPVKTTRETKSHTHK